MKICSRKTSFQGAAQIDSSSLVFPRGAPAESERSVFGIHEHREQGSNKAVQNCLEQFCPCSKIEHDPKDVKQDSVAQNQNAKSISPQKTFITIRNLLKNKLEKYTDTTAPMVKPPETIKGGTSILQSQISCPFQAFATYRLKATKTNKFSQKILRGNGAQLILVRTFIVSTNPSRHEKLMTYNVPDGRTKQMAFIRLWP